MTGMPFPSKLQWLMYPTGNPFLNSMASMPLQVWPNATNNRSSWSYGEPYLTNPCLPVSSGIGAEVKIVLGRIVNLLTGKSIGESSFRAGAV